MDTDITAQPDTRRSVAPLRILLGFIAFVAGLLSVVALALLPPIGVLMDSGEVGATMVNVAQCVLVTVVVVALIGVLMRVIDRRPLREAGWRWSRASLPLLGLGLGVSIAITLGTALLLSTLGVVETVPVPWHELTTSTILLAILARVAQAFFLQGIPEELAFRGYMMQTIADRPKLALAVSTGFFGIIHLVSSGGQENLLERILYLAPATAFGFLAAVLVLRLRSLWPAVGVHAGFHLGTLAQQFLGLDTGTPWGWLGTGVAYAVAGLVALRGHNWEPVRLDR